MKLTGWRRIAAAIWGPPRDPQIYGMLEVDATNMLAFIERSRAAGHRVTVTHVVGRAIARAIGAVPDFNVVIRGTRAYPVDTVDVFFIAAVDGGRDLSGVKVANADRRSVYEVADELARRSAAMREGRDPDLARTKRVMERLPRPLLRASMAVSARLAGDFGLSVKPLGLSPRPFGSAMITNIGSFGLPLGFAPLAWLYRTPLLLLVGEVVDRPMAVEGTVQVRPVLPITATIDHRYADGWHISELFGPFRDYLADPAAHETEPPPIG